MTDMEERDSMEDRMPVSGKFYRHFKGRIYQIKMIAKDSETEELQVVYQGMYPPFQCWVRSLEEFLGPVDLRKYPNARQTMRFVPVSIDELEAINSTVDADGIGRVRTAAAGNRVGAESASRVDDQRQERELLQSRGMTEVHRTQPKEEMDDASLVRALTSGCPEKYLSGRLTEREIAERGCMQILDAETYHEKRQLMVGMKPYLDKRLLHNIAAALDIVLEEGDLDSQYDSLLHCLDTMKHFEGGRLR